MFPLASTSDLRPCPHCNGQVRFEPSAQLLWVCGACGGPVIPGLTAARGAIVESLAAAKRARASTFTRRLASGVAAAVGLTFFAVAAILAFFSGVSATVLGILAVAALVGAYAALKSGDTKRAEAQKLTDDAWLLYLAEAIAHNKGTLSAEDVARAGEIHVTRAAALLESLARRGEIDLNISVEGRLTYGRLATGPRIADEDAFAELEANEEAARVDAEKKRLVNH